MSFARLVRKPLFGTLVGVVVALVACATQQVPMPTPRQADAAAQRWPGTTANDLADGRTLYVERCAGCHSLPLPNAYHANAWPKVIDEMADRAHLSKDERTRVLHYLETVAEPQATASR